MEFSAKVIADLLKGTIEGDPDVLVSDIAKIEEGKPGALSFLANPKYTRYLYTTQSSIVLINEDLQLEKEVQPTLIRVPNAYEAFATLLQAVYKESIHSGIDSLAFIHESAKIGENTYIAPFVYVGENAIVGDNAKLYPHVYLSKNVEVKNDTVLASGVKVYNDCKIGANCIIHAGVVIGADGFGFAPNTNNDYKKVPQVGNVIIEDYVEIGANTTIDRATIGSTIIRRGVKLDNLIQIAHNVEIGENTVIAALTGVSGSTKIGRGCIIAGQVGFVGHIQIHDEVKIGAQSGVTGPTKSNGEILLGSPATDIRLQRRSLAVYKNLPELRQIVNQLERDMKILQEKMQRLAPENP